jgi:arylsulfatase
MFASMKNTLSVATAVASCVVAAKDNVKTDSTSKNSTPNIIVIMTDDQGYGQLEFAPGGFDSGFLSKKFATERYKCNTAKAIEAAKKSMPNISKLACNGVSFTEGFVASPVCAPSRAAFLTARYPAHYGIYDNPDVWGGVDTKEVFLSEKLQKAGYSTAMIGKWHLGKNDTQKVKTESRDYHMKGCHHCIKKHHPLTRGYDYYYGFNSSGAAYYNSPNIFRNYENVKAPGYLTDNFTNEAVKFIAESKGKPFFVTLAYNAPHIPLEQRAPEKYQRFNTGNSEVDNYYATLAAVDDGVGRIIAELKRQNKFDNTLIFYFSDNGAVIDSPEPANGYFRGFKGLTFQGGVHVPMIACWPDGLPKGKKYTKNVSSMDIMPTCLTAAKIKVPGNLDGKNLFPYLEGAKQDEPHEYLFWAGPRIYHWSEQNIGFWSQYYKWITFKSDKKAKTVKKKGPACWTVLSDKWMLQANADKEKFELFNIEKDPGETTDVSAQHSDVVKRLSGAFSKWIEDKRPPLKWEKSKWEKFKK